jgi:hypothetical protein
VTRLPRTRNRNLDTTRRTRRSSSLCWQFSQYQWRWRAPITGIATALFGVCHGPCEGRYSLDSALRALDHIGLICAAKGAPPSPVEPHHMNRILLDLRSHQLVRWLLPSIVLVAGLGWRVEASEFSVSSPAFDGDDHAHYCKCGSNCRGASCCCAHRETKAKVRAPVRSPAGESTRVDASPCVSSAPCGDSGLPGAPASGAFSKTSACTTRGFSLPVLVGQLLPPSPRCVLPTRRASRLDKPPERSAVA